MMVRIAKRAEGLARILVVEDNPHHAELLDDCLLPMGYQLLHAYDGEEALRCVEEDHPDLIILDLALPRVNGYEVCRRVKDNEATNLLPVIMVTASAQREVKLKGLEAGADDFIAKPFDRVELLTRIASLLRVKHLTDELERVKNVLFSLVLALEAKDIYTKGHSERVAEWAVRLSRWKGLPQAEQRVAQAAGLLHDIGKMGISEAILLKPGPLTPEEFDQVRAHAVEGERICQPLQFARTLLPAIRHHHERWDGTGYPDRLKGQAIPEEARILAVADAYDAMTSNRPYRPAMSHDEALSNLLRGIGKQWDPDLVEGFIALANGKKPAVA
jgi:putative two-component system response regulator